MPKDFNSDFKSGNVSIFRRKIETFPCFLLVIICLLYLGAPLSALYAKEQETNKEEETLYVAKKAFEDGFYDVSLGLLERFLRNYPASLKADEASLLMGQCYFHQNRYLDALEVFEKLLSQPSGQSIRDAVLYSTAEVYFKGNNFEKAAGYYKMIIDDNPKSSYLVEAYYSLGWSLFQLQKFSEALNYFKVIEQKYGKEPEAKDVPFKIIECLYNLKDYTALKEKCKSYAQPYSKDPVQKSYLYFYIAEADYYLNNFNEAISGYSQVITITGDEKIKALSWLGIGWSELKLRRYKEAEDIFQKISFENLDSKNQDVCLLGEAIVMSETNRPGEAKKIYDGLATSSQDALVSIQATLGTADALYSLGQYKDAISVYKDVLNKAQVEKIPADLAYKLHYSLAWAYLKQGEFKEAIKEFQKIAKESDDLVVKVSALCQIGDAYQDSKEYNLAMEAYDRVLKDYPDSFYSDYVQYQLGMTMLKSSNYDAAIISLLAFRRNFPSSKLLPEATYALGLAYFQRQDYNSSREMFESFKQEFKDSNLRQQAMYLFGTSLYNLGQFSEAIEAFRDIVRAYPQDLELVQKAEFEIADCYYQAGNEKEAMERFKSLRSKYPDSSLTPEIMWWLGGYYYRHNEPDLARRYLFALIHDYPDSNLIADAYYTIGSIYEDVSNHEQAIENFQKVIELGRADLAGQSSVAIADIYALQSKTELALKLYEDVIKKYPDFNNLIYQKMADLFYRNQDYTQAIEFYLKSLTLAPVLEMASIQFKIAEILEIQSKIPESIEEYLKVPYLYSQNNVFSVKALLRVANIYETKGNLKEAIKIYGRVVELNTEEAKYAKERMDALKAKIK